MSAFLVSIVETHMREVFHEVGTCSDLHQATTHFIATQLKFAMGLPTLNLLTTSAKSSNNVFLFFDISSRKKCGLMAQCDFWLFLQSVNTFSVRGGGLICSLSKVEQVVVLDV